MPEDLTNTEATVSGDNTDELLILDERLNIMVFRFHWHMQHGFPHKPKEVVETHKLFTATGAALLAEKKLIERIKDLNDR